LRPRNFAVKLLTAEVAEEIAEVAKKNFEGNLWRAAL